MCTWKSPKGQYYNIFNMLLNQPHTLVAGETGSGKSVFMDGLITTALYRHFTNAEGSAQFIFIDPKGTEFMAYENLPHTLFYAYEKADFRNALNLAFGIMERRFRVCREKRLRLFPGSDVYVFIDEWAFVMNHMGKACVKILQDLCQKGRAARIHVILATQHPSAKVIPSEVRNNFDSRVALGVQNADASRMIINRSGAEALHVGQCIIKTPEYREGVDCIAPYTPQEEINRLVAWWEDQAKANGYDYDTQWLIEHICAA